MPNVPYHPVPKKKRLTSKKATLRAVVHMRFGPVPPPLARRIAAANDAALDALIVRAAMVESLDDLY